MKSLKERLKENSIRVWINAPSKFNNFHNFHGLCGIAYTKINSLGNDITTIYFTEGEVYSMQIDPLYLEDKNSQNDNLRIYKK